MKKQHFKRKTFSVMLALIFLTNLLHGQKTVTTEEQLWIGALNQTRLSNKWGLWFDAHLRLKHQFVNDLSQTIVRFGPTFYLTDDVRITAAYAYVHTFPGTGHANVSVPEHRPWQQIQWFQKGTKARLMQWIRLEERFRRNVANDDALAKGYRFNWRLRYNLAFFVPITSRHFAPGGLQAIVNNEVFINFGKNILFNHFDQNRLFLGLVYQINKHAQLHAGYMNLYQQLAAGNSFRNQHSIRIFYFHNFDLRD